jgi:gamma-glutamyltranspeptidase
MLRFCKVLLLVLGVGYVWANNTNGAVACESALCTQIGIDTMKEGGNAADAVSSILSHLACTNGKPDGSHSNLHWYCRYV